MLWLITLKKERREKKRWKKNKKRNKELRMTQRKDPKSSLVYLTQTFAFK